MSRRPPRLARAIALFMAHGDHLGRPHGSNWLGMNMSLPA